MVSKMLMKQVWYPRPHDMLTVFSLGLKSAVANNNTIVPLIMSDEGLGTPSDYEAHPENALFVEAAEPNCFPESRINLITVSLEFSLSKTALETDLLHVVKCYFDTIFTSFDDITVNDELSTLDIGEILELQRETTDRQSYPLWNAVDMKDGNSLAANVPGLTTNQIIEGVAFSNDTFYDALHYYTNGNKLKKVQGGLKVVVLTRDRPYRRYQIHLRSKVKRMNPYTFFGVLCGINAAGSGNQFPTVAADVTDISHVRVSIRSRFNEWNPEFNMKRV